MESTGASVETALKEAHLLGYAEADPTSDVDGYDARAKLVILIQAGLGLKARSEEIPCLSISAIEAVDFAYASELNCSIRQISIAQKETLKDAKSGTRLLAAVRPTLVPRASLLGPPTCKRTKTWSSPAASLSAKSFCRDSAQAATFPPAVAA